MSSVFWEDDPIQLEDNEYKGGANRVSLIQARHNFYCLVHVKKK